MTLATVFFQMLSLALLIGTGFVCARIKMVDNHSMGHISGLINNVFNPMMMVSAGIASVGNLDFHTMLIVLGVAAGMFLLFVVLSYLIAPLLDHRPGQKEMFQLSLIFSNLGFMGIPVVRGVFGAEYVVYITCFILMFNIIFYSYGEALMEGTFSVTTLKAMVNPGFICCFITLLVVLLELPVPAFIANSAEYLGDAASPLAMMAVGVTLAHADLKAVFASPKIYLFTLIKMIVIPLCLLPVIHSLPLSPELMGVCMVEISMPVANLPLILGTKKGLDCSACSACIIMTTIVSVITIPVLVALI